MNNNDINNNMNYEEEINNLKIQVEQLTANFNNILFNIKNTKSNRKRLTKEMVLNRKMDFKQYLIDNPVENYKEFINTLIEINPNIDDKFLKYIQKNNPNDNMKIYNEILIDMYEGYENLRSYKIAKAINESDIDYSNYKCKNLLGECIEQKGIKVNWICKKTGIPRSTLESIIRNSKLMPTVDKAIKICKVLDENIEKIFPLQEQTNNDK